jgi:signal transduction histidine kinase
MSLAKSDVAKPGRRRPVDHIADKPTVLSIQEDCLKKAHQEMEHLLSSLTTIFIGLSPQIIVTRWNSVAEDVFAMAASDMIGTPLNQKRLGWDWKLVLNGIHQCCQQRQSIRVDDIPFEQSNHKQGYLGITINPVVIEESRLSGYTIIGADITERKTLERNMAQTEKLKSIGQLAAGIAHEINTPTQYVGDNVRFLQDAFEDLSQLIDSYAMVLKAAKSGTVSDTLIADIEDRIEEVDAEYLLEEIPIAIQQTQEGVARIARIVRAMKEFSHPGQEEKTKIDINQAIESTVTVARNEWKYVADLETDFDPSLPPVPCLPGEFNQVILNLIINAAHAIGEKQAGNSAAKGTIKIGTCKRSDGVVIKISDTGSGIPADIQHRIFDPFFTTKEVGKGTGQGLAISHSVIVEKHGGKLELETETGRGTTFTICLPVEAPSR